jgi:MoaA/NifB/PqqE/SkfB family radical SAM enzyme
MNEFSSLKAAWHIDRIASLRDGRPIAPTHVQIILSDLCNQDCHFCAYRMEGGFSTAMFSDAEGNKNPNRRMPTEKALEILDDCAAAGVGAIEFTGGGEPTVHPRWKEIIGHAQALGMQTGLVTNGVKLEPTPVLERLTWLRVSLDAGEAETYQRIRRSAAWPKVMNNLRMVGGLTGPYVGVGFVVTRENYTELAQAAALVKSFGIPYIRVSAMFSMSGADYYEGIAEAINKQRELAKAMQDDKFKVIDFFDDRLNDLRMAAPDYDFCGYQQFVVYIGGDQRVYSCCTNAYTPHGQIGDLSNMRFADWLLQPSRLDFDARGCHHCQFNDKNRVINYMVGKPAHVDFV